LKLVDETLLSAFQGYKSQLRIFNDIEDLRMNAMEYIEIHNYGGSPISLDVILHGPRGSFYEGSKYHVKVEFHDPYPYQQPSIRFMTRIFAVNVISQISGIGLLYHIKYLWNSDWTLRKLFDHIATLLAEADYSLLPQEMNEILNLHMCIHSKSVEDGSSSRSRSKQTSSRRNDEKSSLESSDGSTSTSYYLSSSAEPKTLTDASLMQSSTTATTNAPYDSISDDDTEVVSPMNRRYLNSHRADSPRSGNGDEWSTSTGEMDSKSRSESIFSGSLSRDTVDSKDDKTTSSTSYETGNSLSYINYTSYYENSMSYATGSSSMEGSTSATYESSYSSSSSTEYTGASYDDATIDSYKLKLKSMMNYLSRTEQIHLNTMLLYKSDPKQFKQMIDYYSTQHPCQLQSSILLRELIRDGDKLPGRDSSGILVETSSSIASTATAKRRSSISTSSHK
jgi:ubiquitin-conjugating enzyme E2 H